jgi:hypothetical protein
MRVECGLRRRTGHRAVATRNGGLTVRYAVTVLVAAIRAWLINGWLKIACSSTRRELAETSSMKRCRAARVRGRRDA